MLPCQEYDPSILAKWAEKVTIVLGRYILFERLMLWISKRKTRKDTEQEKLKIKQEK